jgi:hypothetical protein
LYALLQSDICSDTTCSGFPAHFEKVCLILDAAFNKGLNNVIHGSEKRNKFRSAGLAWLAPWNLQTVQSCDCICALAPNEHAGGIQRESADISVKTLPAVAVWSEQGDTEETH